MFLAWTLARRPLLAHRRRGDSQASLRQRCRSEPLPKVVCGHSHGADHRSPIVRAWQTCFSAQRKEQQ